MEDAENTASVTRASVYVTLLNKTACLSAIHSHRNSQNMRDCRIHIRIDISGLIFTDTGPYRDLI